MRRKTEDGSQRTENGSQRTEDRSWKIEDGGVKKGVRNTKLEEKMLSRTE